MFRQFLIFLPHDIDKGPLKLASHIGLKADGVFAVDDFKAVIVHRLIGGEEVPEELEGEPEDFLGPGLGARLEGAETGQDFGILVNERVEDFELDGLDREVRAELLQD